MSRFDPLIEALVDRGWYMGDDLLSRPHAADLATEAIQSWNAGHYRLAGIGRDHGHQLRPDIRGDSIWWVDDDCVSEAMDAYRETIEGMRHALNHDLYLGLDSFEIQFARYPPGSSYARHIDRFSDRTLRTISCILYLNDAWKIDDGGQLRMHLDDGPKDVLPRIGTWVVFRSELIAHEVLAPRRERYSLTGWFRRRPLNPLLQGA